MKRNLADLAEVRILFVFRDKAPDAEADGNVHVFSIRDLVSNWPLDSSKLIKTSVSSEKLAQAVQASDILLPGRGQTFPARLYSGEIGPILPAGQIYVIRPKNPGQLRPSYLCWHLNRPGTQKAMIRALTGTTIQALNKSSLLKLEIELPPIQVQERVSIVHDLYEKRNQIRRQLISLESDELELTCAELIARGMDE